jgi:hypothetical protein
MNTIASKYVPLRHKSFPKTKLSNQKTEQEQKGKKQKWTNSFHCFGSKQNKMAKNNPKHNPKNKQNKNKTNTHSITHLINNQQLLSPINLLCHNITKTSIT